MVESMTHGQVDGFCVGAMELRCGRGQAWAASCISVAIFLATRQIRRWRSAGATLKPHPTSRERSRAPSQRRRIIWKSPEASGNRGDVGAAQPRQVDARLIQRTLVGELMIAPNETRANPNHLILGQGGALRPDAAHALWLDAQMLRWGQAESSMERVEEATHVFRADLFDASLGADAPSAAAIGDPVGAFDAFQSVDNIRTYLGGFSIGRKH
jgi:hypothetical protein